MPDHIVLLALAIAAALLAVVEVVRERGSGLLAFAVLLLAIGLLWSGVR